MFRRSRVQRHPAVIDILSGAPLGPAGSPVAPAGPPAHPATAAPTPTSPPAAPGAPEHAPGGGDPGNRKRWVLAGIGGLLVITVVVWAFAWGGDSQETTATAATSSPATTEDADPHSAAAQDTSSTPQSRGDSFGPECNAPRGSQSSARGAIEAFEYAYYVSRSGQAARALASPTSTVQPADALQTYIDAVPVGTTYCLRTEPITETVFLVNLSEMRPGEPAASSVMTVSTVQIDGKWYVDAFK